ncbi:MAG: SRPBCC family protein [Phycisphaerales bacterium]|nr:SRPBCC family protein [Phycisphaerales bacterium]
MARFELNMLIKAPVERVFDVFTTLDRLADRHEDIVEIERVTDGPIGPGTIFNETRSVFGREFTSTMEFSEFAPDNHWVISSKSGGFLYRFAFDLQPEAEGTRLILQTTSKPLNPIAFLLGLASPILMRVARSAGKRDIEKLAKVAEEGDQPVADEQPSFED